MTYQHNNRTLVQEINARNASNCRLHRFAHTLRHSDHLVVKIPSLANPVIGFAILLHILLNL